MVSKHAIHRLFAIAEQDQGRYHLTLVDLEIQHDVEDRTSVDVRMMTLMWQPPPRFGSGGGVTTSPVNAQGKISRVASVVRPVAGIQSTMD